MPCVSCAADDTRTAVSLMRDTNTRRLSIVKLIESAIAPVKSSDTVAVVVKSPSAKSANSSSKRKIAVWFLSFSDSCTCKRLLPERSSITAINTITISDKAAEHTNIQFQRLASGRSVAALFILDSSCNKAAVSGCSALAEAWLLSKNTCFAAAIEVADSEITLNNAATSFNDCVTPT